MKKYELNNWYVGEDPRHHDPYLAPECRIQCLGGNRVGDGDVITTGIVGKSADGCVVTRSGSHYKLMEVDPAYEAEYPDAFNRLMNSLEAV